VYFPLKGVLIRQSKSLVQLAGGHETVLGIPQSPPASSLRGNLSTMWPPVKPVEGWRFERWVTGAGRPSRPAFLVDERFGVDGVGIEVVADAFPEVGEAFTSLMSSRNSA
jgi:hypothetical protein